VNLDRIRDVANAVLYEGYILYPYRPSSIKNRQRWTFGGVFPRNFSGSDPHHLQTEMLVEGGDDTELDLNIRFLAILSREIGRLEQPIGAMPTVGEPNFTLVPSLDLDGRRLLAWEEAAEREIAEVVQLGAIARAERGIDLDFDATRTMEPVQDAAGAIHAVLIRSSTRLCARVSVSAQRLAGNLFCVTLKIDNLSPLPAAARLDRNAAQPYAFASTHAICTLRAGNFISLLDPPDSCRAAAAACRNEGLWPVLVGMEGDRDAMLASPIILYDYPQIAPESAGDLFDGTEIDEILTLRILAMTDAEKAEMIAADGRARALLERTHALSAADLAALHGVMHPTAERRTPRDSIGACGHGPKLVSLIGGGRDLAVGDEVRLKPKAGGDIFDLALTDQVAIISAIERDFEDRIHVAVTLRDDPGRDLGEAGFPGHRFFFSQDELEPLQAGGEP
jgi:hydrogenase maturation protease